MAIKSADHPELTGFGIHGTWQRDSIGKQSSAGCIRMLNEDVEELFDLVPRKISVTITE
jgi:lipoprotein-anchoring transpeptidase ErfK/SrfK